MKFTEIESEQLADIIESVDNLAHALNLPFPDKQHVSAMKSNLPEVVSKLKSLYVDITGDDPWEDS